MILLKEEGDCDDPYRGRRVVLVIPMEKEDPSRNPHGAGELFW